MMKQCPKCRSKRVAPILYGLSAFSEELEQKLNNEELYLGGYCVWEQCISGILVGAKADVYSFPKRMTSEP